MTDHTTSERVRELEEELAALRAKLEAEQQPKPGPPKDGKIWATDFGNHHALWLWDGRNVCLDDGIYGACDHFEHHGKPSYTVPLSDLRALVEAHDPASGGAPPAYNDLMYAWNHPYARPACPDWLDTTGATTDRSKFPPLEPGQLWRKRTGESVMPSKSNDRYLWPRHQDGVMALAKHNPDYDGDEGPDHALVEYLGRVK